MRLWSLHPKYLDARGLVALWREALLAQAVLRGKTKGYRHHPQLERFKSARDPVAAIGAYLSAVDREASSRGYEFNYTNIVKHGGPTKMATTHGQLKFELRHLLEKMKSRDPGQYRGLLSVEKIAANPVFSILPGPVAPWERSCPAPEAKSRDTTKPTVVVSRCLGFEACRYDGTKVACPAVRRLKRYVDLIPVCPEMEIGLGVPRHPIRIVQANGRRRLVQPESGSGLTRKMRRFADVFLSSVVSIDGFILKSRSPSCGIGDVKVYRNDATDTKTAHRRGTGFFAFAVLERFPGLAVVDDIGLEDPVVRNIFLARVLAHSVWRRSDRTGKAARSKKPSLRTGQGRAGRFSC